MADAGFDPVEIASVATWKPGRDGAAVVVGASTADGLEHVASFAEAHPHVPAVAVLPELTLADVAAAIRAGATAVIGEDESTEAYHTVLAAAMSGRTAVPKDLAKALAMRVPSRPDADAWITDAEAGWLRHLAAGRTVATIAEEVGFSEREMFRMLHDLYVRIGVRNRTEAIIWATRHAVLDEPDG